MKAKHTQLIDAIDVLSARLSQADGIIAAIMSTYTQQQEDTMQHVLTAKSSLNTLWALSELIAQASKACATLESRKIS